MQPEKQLTYKEAEEFRQQFARAAGKELFSYFAQTIKETKRLINAYKNRFVKLSDSKEEDKTLIKNLRSFNARLLEVITKYQKENLNSGISNPFEGYLDLLDNEIKPLKLTLRKKEKFENYQLIRNDSIFTLIKKTGLNISLFWKLQGRKIRNVLLKLRKKPEENLEIYRWRRIPFRKMAGSYLGVELMDVMVDIIDRFHKQRIKTVLELWKFDEALDEKLQVALSKNEAAGIYENIDSGALETFVEKLLDDLDQLRKNTEAEVIQAVSDTFSKLGQSMQIADTPDLPLKRFHESRLNSRKEMVLGNLIDLLKNWTNTRNTLFDDWAVDVEIVLLYYAVLDDYSDLKVKINNFVNNQLSVNFNELNDFIKASGQRISESTNSIRKITETLAAERDIINSKLVDKMLSKVIEKLSGSFIDDLVEFRDKTLNLVSKITMRRGFVKSTSYERGVKDSEINYISPPELLGFEALPHFEKSVEDVQKLVENSLEKVRLKLIGMGTVCDFSLESALMLLEQKRNAVKKAETVAIEGYERARTHVEEAAALVDTVQKEPLKKLEKAIHEFYAEIQKLKNTENIFELNVRIARIKAIERSKKARQDALQWARNILPEFLKLIKKQVSDSGKLVNEFKSRMGVTTEKKHISYEVSEFIRQTELSLKKLPFVYQRLYQLRPTDEDRFFVNRESEFDQLKEAFDDWQKERFVTTVVISEKGSGTTSFLNYFLRRIDTDMTVIHESPEQKIYQPEQYFAFFSKILEIEKPESNDEIIKYLNKQAGKKIIIIENLHHLFLKIVNGLDCQKMLLDVIVHTAKKVFWIGSYTIHSLDYLDKAIHLSDHFVRDIRLQPMSSDHLKEIIFKRNSLSGYRVKFEPDEDTTHLRSFKKLDQDQQQAYLEGIYFNNLSKLSNGNISLAQLYWLRSTNHVSDDTISVGSVEEIDLSFVKDIKVDYLFALYTLLVHDGLTLKDYARVFNLPESDCGKVLIPMLEKGLLIRPKEKFNINPIIFRQVANYLRSRNFIS